MSGVLAAILSSRPARWAGAVLLVLGALLGLRSRWRGEGRQEERREAEQEARDAHARMDRADVSHDDAAADRQWLRERARRGR